MNRNGQPVKRWLLAAILLCAFVIVAAGLLHLSAGLLMARFALTTGPNGATTPGSLGVPFERATIPSNNNRRLDGYVVPAETSCKNAPVLLIYHGIHETISDWVKTQRFLYQHCVTSVIFDASGSGDSSRPASMEAIGQDAISAYRFTRLRFPGQRVFVLGHSMGNGVMLEEIPRFPVTPDGVIVAGAFSSLRNQGVIRKHWLHRAISYAIPDWWNNVQAIKQIHVPLLVVHSDADRVNPLAGGLAIYAAANQPKTMVVLHGFSHNALEQNPSELWWDAALRFIKAPQHEIPKDR
jgi:uncharacterized protein